MLSNDVWTCGTICTLRAGSRRLWWSLLIVVALAWSPNAPPKVDVDLTPVGIDGSSGVNALAVAPVSLTADGMLPLRTPARISVVLFEYFLLFARISLVLFEYFLLFSVVLSVVLFEYSLLLKICCRVVLSVVLFEYFLLLKICCCLHIALFLSLWLLASLNDIRCVRRLSPIWRTILCSTS